MTNKAWVLGNDRLKQRIQKQLERRVEPNAKGGIGNQSSSESIESDPIDLRAVQNQSSLTPLICIDFSHLQYRSLGKTDEERQAAYRQLFKHRIPESSLDEIRYATNKAWVLGNDRFKQRIQKQLERRVEPNAKGGDRKSEQYRINRV